MAIMNLLVAFNGTEASEAALRYAASLAKQRGAHLTALLVHSVHDTFDTTSRWIPREARNLLADARESIVSEIVAHFERLRPTLGLGDDLTLRTQKGRVDIVLSDTARSFDMLIVGRPMRGDDEHVVLHPDRIALLAGRPVIVVPEGYDVEARHSHAALAWDGGRAAARAMSDSLRLLEQQGKVSVLTIGPPVGSLDDLMAHLALHDIETVHEEWPVGHPLVESIVSYCKRNDPSLLVMGAYEHSKFRDDFLGGHTAKILREISIPILLSH